MVSSQNRWIQADRLKQQQTAGRKRAVGDSSGAFEFRLAVPFALLIAWTSGSHISLVAGAATQGGLVASCSLKTVFSLREAQSN